MIKKLYALRDLKSFWTDPFLEVNDDAAKRGVALAIQRHDPGSLIGFSPADFDLYQIAEYETVSGVVNTEVPGTIFPRYICSALSLSGGDKE